jgi:hypothetical protein
MHRVLRMRRPAAGAGPVYSLIETTVACGLMVVVLTGLAGMTTLATRMTENDRPPHHPPRPNTPSTRWSSCMELTYGDAQSNTTVFPSVTSGGTGLATGGNADPASPVVGYADYLDTDGNPLCTVANPARRPRRRRGITGVCGRCARRSRHGTSGCPASLPGQHETRFNSDRDRQDESPVARSKRNRAWSRSRPIARPDADPHATQT